MPDTVRQVNYCETCCSSDPPPAMSDVVVIFVLVMPILIFLIVSGAIGEFRGPGGLQVTFNKVATTSILEMMVKGSVASQVSVGADTKFQRLEPGVTGWDTTRYIDIDENHLSYMVVTFGKGNYTLKDLHDSVEVFYPIRNFEMVLFLTEDERFVGYMPVRTVKQILNDPERGQEFVDSINAGSLKLLSWPGIVSRAVSTVATNTEALREMATHNSPMLVVVNAQGRVVGIVEREQIITKIILALIESSMQQD